MDRTGTTQIYSERHPAAQEAAILYSAGFRAAAAALLAAEIAGPGGTLSRQPWLILFELHHGAGDRDAFERLLPRYQAAFPDAFRPGWGHPAPIAAAGTLALAGVLDARCGCLSRIQEHAIGRKTLAVDMSEVERIDFAFAGELAALLRTFHVQGKRVILANIGELNAALFEAVGADQHVVLMRRRGVQPAARPTLVALERVAA